jgi:Protein of unknown function (DUF3592)
MNMSVTRLRWLYLRGPLLLIGIVFSITGVAILLTVLYLWNGEQAFEANAARATATVTGKDSRVIPSAKPGKPPTTTYVLNYRFKDPTGQEFTGSVGAGHGDWMHAKNGDTLEIEYDAADPTSSRRPGSGKGSGSALLVVAGFGLLFTAVGIGSLTCLLVRSERRVRLIRYGVPALGTVNTVAENKSALRFQGSYRVHFQFADQCGDSWEGQGPPQAWSLAGRWNAGDVVLVLYDPKNPRRNEADLFETRSDEQVAMEDARDQGGDEG